MQTVIFYAHYVAQWMALLPLGVCAVLLFMKRDVSHSLLWLSAAFAVSFVADSLGKELYELKVNNWWLMYFAAPIQFAMFARVVLEKREARTFAVALITLLAVVGGLRGTLTAPETVVQVVGGVMLGWLIWPQAAVYRWPVVVYCLFTAPLLLMLAMVPMQRNTWDVLWLIYQALRLTALVLVSWTLIRPPRLRLEVSDGSGAAKTAARPGHFWQRRFRSAVRSADRVPVARKTG